MLHGLCRFPALRLSGVADCESALLTPQLCISRQRDYFVAAARADGLVTVLRPLGCWR